MRGPRAHPARTRDVVRSAQTRTDRIMPVPPLPTASLIGFGGWELGGSLSVVAINHTHKKRQRVIARNLVISTWFVLIFIIILKMSRFACNVTNSSTQWENSKAEMIQPLNSYRLEWF